MDKAIGQVFKQLRLAKDLAAKEVASQKLSYPQLLKFEKGETNLTVDKFFDALLSINVSAKEFQRAYQQLTQSEDLKFNGYIVMAYVQKNVAKLVTLLRNTEEMMKLEPDKKRHRLNQVEIRALLFDLDKRRKVPAVEIQFLANYLLQIKEWSEYEIWLLANSTGIFDLNLLVELTDKMIHWDSPLIWLAKNQRKINIAVLNVIKRLILSGNFEQVKTYFVYLRAHLSYDLDMHEKAVLIGSELLFELAKDGKNKKAREKFIACLKGLECFECFDTINFLTEFAQELELNFGTQI